MLSTLVEPFQGGYVLYHTTMIKSNVRHCTEYGQSKIIMLL